MDNNVIPILPDVTAELQQEHIGFIGAGNIALALAKFLINSKNIEGNQMYACAETTQNFKPWQDLGVTCTTNNREVVMNCNVIFLAVHPRSFKEAISQASFEEGNMDALSRKLFISAIEGITLKSLLETLTSITSDFGVIRIATSIPVEIEVGCIAYTIGENITQDECDKISQFLSPARVCEIVSESQIDLCSALIGSGTCFVLTAIEALSNGGIEMGISRQTAVEIAAKMMLLPAQEVIDSTITHNPRLAREFMRSSGEIIVAVRDVLKDGLVKAKFVNVEETALKRVQEISRQNR